MARFPRAVAARWQNDRAVSNMSAFLNDGVLPALT